MSPTTELPNSNSPDLYLTHPTPEECIKIWTNTSTLWKDALDLPMHLKLGEFLLTVPLAKNGGMTMWILVDKNLPPNQRPILCSCESLRKRSLTSDSDGNVEENIVHGIASVFCAEEYRRRGYAGRHMSELAKVLQNWQSEYGRCAGSVLYSDIGKTFYAKVGWEPHPSNFHLLFPSIKGEWPTQVKPVLAGDLPDLCLRDEKMVRDAMALPDKSVDKRLTILPNLDHMLWHISKEEFVTEYIFGKIPQHKGAIAGNPGQQVWAIWTHRYYHHPETGASENVLYILRIVVEGDETANKPLSQDNISLSGPQDSSLVASFKSVMQAAQAEAADWQLSHVKVWKPSPLVQSLVRESGIEYKEVERTKDSIASGLWYGEHGKSDGTIEWINNEHYAWC